MRSYPRTLWLVVAFTVLVGCAESAFGLREGSSFLVKDGVEWGYGAAIYAVAALTYGRSPEAEFRGGMLVALILALGGLQGGYEVVSGLLTGGDDDDLGLTTSSLISLFGAIVVAALLLRFRRSHEPAVEGAWLSARNDVVTSTLDLTAVLVLKLIPSKWPQTASDSIGVILAFWAAFVVARDTLQVRSAGPADPDDADQPTTAELDRSRAPPT